MATKEKSTKGRKPLAPAEKVGPELDPARLEERHGQLVTVSEHQSAVVAQFGDGLPWHPDHYEAAIKTELRRGAEAFLRAGSYLVVAKECSAHGEWLGLLDRVGLGPDTAQRMMAAARRIAELPNAATSRHLIDATKTQGKLVELLSLPEDQFKELATTGETEGLSLDDVEGMTVRELRAAIRDARADLDAKDQRITKLSEDLNRAEEKTAKAQRKWKAATPDEQQIILEQRVVEAKHGIIANIGAEKSGLTAAILDLANHCNEHDLDCATFLGDTIGELLNALREVRDGYEYGFAIPVVHDREA